MRASPSREKCALEPEVFTSLRTETKLPEASIQPQTHRRTRFLREKVYSAEDRAPEWIPSGSPQKGKTLSPRPPFRPRFEQGSSAQYDLQLIVWPHRATFHCCPFLSFLPFPLNALLRTLVTQKEWMENFQWNAFPRTSSPSQFIFRECFLSDDSRKKA